MTLAGDQPNRLARPAAIRGLSQRDGGRLTNVLLRNHGLHVDVAIDPTHPIGKRHPAGIKDVVLESAVSTIMDCEDSVATVDAADKTVVYRNWCGIMRGTLTASFHKGGSTVNRHLNPDREYTAPDGKKLVLPGRSMLLVRHVGAHVLTEAVTDAAGKPIAETFLDCVITTLAALHDLKQHRASCATAARAASTSSSRSSTGPRKSRCPSSCSRPSSARSACRRTR